MVIMAESEKDLQCLLDKLAEWCSKWRMRLNTEKSKILHFRGSRCKRSQFVFKYAGTDLETVEHYKYLGIFFDEFLKFEYGIEVLEKSAGRALGCIISKFKYLKNAGYKTFKKLYESQVVPISDYFSCLWSHKKLRTANKVHNKALRYFLGVSCKTPIYGMNGDIGWSTPVSRHYLNMLKYWNRLNTMDDSRIAKIVFNWDVLDPSIGWANTMAQLFEKLNIYDLFETRICCNLEYVTNQISILEQSNWLENLETKPKLRTYKTFKYIFETEWYVQSDLSRSRRSILAQIRFGVLALKIETGRYRNLAIHERTCDVCEGGYVEDEKHFICKCNFYDDIRGELYNRVTERQNQDFMNYSDDDKFSYLLSKSQRYLAEFLEKAWIRRRGKIYEQN